MEPGDIVSIFLDPWTRAIHEGEAELIELLEDNGDHQRWHVRYLADDFRADRVIATYNPFIRRPDSGR